MLGEYVEEVDEGEEEEGEEEEDKLSFLRIVVMEDLILESSSAVRLFVIALGSIMFSSFSCSLRCSSSLSCCAFCALCCELIYLNIEMLEYISTAL